MNQKEEIVQATDSQSEYVLEIEGVSKAFPGVQALKDVDVRLRRGEVLAVVGENGAGKSTLMKILDGVYTPDEGVIKVEGQAVAIDSVETATRVGIALVHQELNLCDNLSIAANVFLGRESPKKGTLRLLNDKDQIDQTRDILQKVGLDHPPTALVRDIPIGAQQLVEIAKALSINAKVVMFDEPTSSLSERETERLFAVIRDLRSHGVSVIYISHRLGEVKEVADRVTVLRDGRVTGGLAAEEISREAMIRLMVGRDIEKYYRKSKASATDVRLEVRGFKVPENSDKVIDLKVHGGEIVVLSGLVGAGRTEFLQSLFGVSRPLGGELLIDGKKVEVTGPADAIRAGMALVPEDRKLHGIVVEMDVENNIALPGLRSRLSKMSVIKRSEVKELAERMVKELDIRLHDTTQIAESLSGGNQQKVVVAKWLSMQPKVLLLDEPTRGIDVGAKAEIYRLLDDLAGTGVAILVASSEMHEVLGIGDRIVVLCEGKITGELTPDEASEEIIMRYATESGT